MENTTFHGPYLAEILAEGGGHRLEELVTITGISIGDMLNHGDGCQCELAWPENGWQVITDTKEYRLDELLLPKGPVYRLFDYIEWWPNSAQAEYFWQGPDNPLA